MKPEDFRVGNWIWGTALNAEKVHETRAMKVRTETLGIIERNGNKYFTPIELTDHILKLCGADSPGHYIMIRNDFYLVFHAMESTKNYLYIPDENLYVFDLSHIKYLHQLQNLFYSLTGKELEIEL